MFSWGAQRKVLYLSAVIFVLLLVIGIPVYFKYFDIQPTCFDNKQNQDERGVDCGGVCVKLCSNEINPPLVLSERVFRAGNGVYSAIAMVENTNQSFARRVQFVFKAYDKNNILVDEKFGETFIPPLRVFPVFQHSLYSGNREINKVTFSFIGNIEWERRQFNDPKLSFTDIKIDGDTRKTISVLLQNDEVYRVSNIQVIAVIVDENSNIIRASQTIVNDVPAKSSKNISFTWNEVFEEDVSKVEFVARVIPRDIQ